MKNYNKILEAVNRGIQLALDDFNDEVQVQNVKSKQIQNRDYTKEYLDLLSDVVVDLGLPSGTLWCKYNLDVNPNQLSKAEDWCGNYYAWGELEPNKTNENGKIYFDWSNYKFGNEHNLTKYCNNPKYGLKDFTDNLSKLQSEDDIDYQNKKYYNYKFHIPSKEQYEELLKYTNNYWVENYDPNKLVHNPEDDGGVVNLNGRIFEGKNGNQMFIPTTGYYYRSSFELDYSHCFLWTSSLCLDDPRNVYYMYFDSNNIKMMTYHRYFGHCVRPVINL